MIRFKEGVTAHELLPHGSFVQPQVMRLSPEEQTRLREKHPELQKVPKEFVLKTYALNAYTVHNLFYELLPADPLSPEKSKQEKEKNGYEMAKILKDRQEFVADYFHDILPNLVARSVFIPIIDTRGKEDLFALYELQEKIDTKFNIYGPNVYGLNITLERPEIKERAKDDLLAFCQRAQTMHLQDKNTR